MFVGKAAGLFAAGGLLRATGSRSAGRKLMRALDSDDESLRTLAGMFLAQAGARSLPLLREAMERRESLPMVLTLMADVGEPALAEEIRPFLGDDDPKVSRSARSALRTLERAGSER